MSQKTVKCLDVPEVQIFYKEFRTFTMIDTKLVNEGVWKNGVANLFTNYICIKERKEFCIPIF